MNSNNRSTDKILKEFDSIPKLEMNPEDKQRIRRDLLIRQRDINTEHRSHIQWSGILAGTIGVTILVFGYFAVVENHTVPTTTHHHVITASNPAQSSTTESQKLPHRSKSVSSTDKSAIKLLRQQTHFKAVLPSFLPKGYSSYTARLQTTTPDHQILWLTYKGPKKYQLFDVAEESFVAPKTLIPSASRANASNGFKVVNIDGTHVTIRYKLEPYTYNFVKDGLYFHVVSSLNAPDDAMKFVKSLIKGGATWN